MSFRFPLLAGASLALIVVIAGCGDTANPCAGSVALVNSTPISKADYQTLLTYTLNFYKWGNKDSIYYTHDICKEYVFHKACKTIKSSLLSRMIDQDIVERYAQNHGLAINANDRKLAISAENQLKKSFGGGSQGNLAFQVYLEKLHTSLKNFRKIELQQILTAKVNAHVVPASISGPQVFVYQILVPVGGPRLADKALHEQYVAKARTRAEAIASQIRARGDFAGYARKYSRDPLTKRSGGALGWVGRPGGDAAFNNAVFTAPKNEVTVVESHFGFHVIKVTDEQVLPYTGATLAAARQHEFATWLRRQLAKTKVTRCS